VEKSPQAQVLTGDEIHEFAYKNAKALLQR
jgi:hypothetical protein